jgi:hypothetical protein
MEDFIAEAFGPSRYHKPVMFRGFFFTSALSSRDVMAAAAREGELSFQTGFTATMGDYAKGFFLLRLLEKCIIPEARLAANDKDQKWGLRFRRYGMQIAAVALFLLSGIFLGTSFMNNYSALESLDSVYATFEAEQKKTPTVADAGDALPELEKIARSTLFIRQRTILSSHTVSGFTRGKPLIRRRTQRIWARSTIVSCLPFAVLPRNRSKNPSTTSMNSKTRSGHILCCANPGGSMKTSLRSGWAGNGPNVTRDRRIRRRRYGPIWIISSPTALFPWNQMQTWWTGRAKPC